MKSAWVVSRSAVSTGATASVSTGTARTVSPPGVTWTAVVSGACATPTGPETLRTSPG